MATFAYIGKNRDGSDARGTFEAPSLDAAREEARKRGIALEDVRETAPKKPKPAPLPWSAATPKEPHPVTVDSTYAPLHETLRIFAGWLIAWYGVIYALGFLESTGRLPSIPFVHELFLSPLVLQFTFGTFLFLALSNVHRWLGKGILVGCLLTIAWIALVAGFVRFG